MLVRVRVFVGIFQKAKFTKIIQDFKNISVGKICAIGLIICKNVMENLDSGIDICEINCEEHLNYIIKHP